MTRKITPLEMRRLRRWLAEQFGDKPAPRNVINARARTLGVTPDHLARQLRTPQATRRVRVPLNDEQLAYLAKYKRAKPAWNALVEEKKYDGSYSTFRRQAAVTSKAILAGILEGEDALRDTFVFRAYASGKANAVWQQDSMYSKVRVVKRRSVVEPVVEVVLDDHSRLITGIAFAVNHPNGATASMALAEAVHGQLMPGNQPARPTRQRYDQALYYTTSEQYQEVLVHAEIRPEPVMGYSGHLKGKVERCIRTLRAECLDLMPGVRRVAQLLGQKKQADGRDRLLTWDEFVKRVLEWVRYYNTERLHSALGGRTPAEVYSESAEPMHDLDELAMRSMLRRPGETRTVSKNGVRFADIDYIHADLTGLVGETVEIGFRDSDPTRLDLFIGGRWLCTARPVEHWDKNDEAVYEQRNRLFKRARAIRARASELRSGDAADRDVTEETDDDAFIDELLAADDSLDQELA